MRSSEQAGELQCHTPAGNSRRLETEREKERETEIQKTLTVKTLAAVDVARKLCLEQNVALLSLLQ